MNVRYLVFFILTKILICYVSTIPTPVSNRDSNSDQFEIGGGFEKSPITAENGNSVANSLQSTLRTAKNFASNLYYGENQQIRGDMLCCFFPCCRENGEEKNADRLEESSSEASKVNIYREDTSEILTDINIESEPEIAPQTARKKFSKDFLKPSTATKYFSVVPSSHKCGLIKRMLCCFFPCCRENGEEKNADRLDESSSEASKVNIYREDSSEAPIHTGTESEPKINTTPHLIRQNTIVSTIREWMQNDPNPYFPPTVLEDHMIERFYYVCQNDPEMTKQKIRLFFQYRFEMRRFFTDRDPLAENLQKSMNVVYVKSCFLPLPEKTKHGQQLYIFRLEDPNLENFNFLDHVKSFYDIADLRMKTEKEIPTGDIPIYDISKSSLSHLLKLQFDEDVPNYLKITQEANPIFLQKIHVINTPLWLRGAFPIVKAFLKPETADKIVLHKDAKALFKYFPDSVEVMPSDYGGEGAPIAEIRENWKKKLGQKENRDWLMSNPWRAEVLGERLHEPEV